jgi:recombination protein RecR
LDILPEGVTRLIEEFSKLPSIGPKTAERLVFYLLKSDDYQGLGQAVINLKEGLQNCEVCQNFATSNRCSICSNQGRNQRLICVVSQPLDIVAIEKTGLYKGTYHVLHGVISPVEGIGPDDLEMESLFERVQKVKPEEIILATNPNLEGETTALYVSKKLENFDGKITKLAHGLPIGADLEYADQMTLGRALNNRLSF